MDQKQSVQHFLDLIKRSHRGKFKIYIGMIAGVGKSYRMLQEAHQLLEVGVDVKIGYIETHGRPDTEALVSGLPVIARRKLFYKGKELEEMDLQGILNTHPEIVIETNWPTRTSRAASTPNGGRTCCKSSKPGSASSAP